MRLRFMESPITLTVTVLSSLASLEPVVFSLGAVVDVASVASVASLKPWSGAINQFEDECISMYETQCCQMPLLEDEQP